MVFLQWSQMYRIMSIPAYDTLMAGKQNKITFGQGLSYDSIDNTLTVVTSNTLWTEDVDTGTIGYSNVVIYGNKIELNQKEVATYNPFEYKTKIS